MRDWNIGKKGNWWWLKMFLSYLWGIETAAREDQRYMQKKFLSYLWGIETHDFSYRFGEGPRFYPTYEGLKLFLDATEIKEKKVFILPMRDWNSFSDHPRKVVFSFLSYLWGIETHVFPRIKARIHWVFILPMRDWNCKDSIRRGKKRMVFILPMRDWNSSLMRRGREKRRVFILPMRVWNISNKNHWKFLYCVFILLMRDWNLLR